MVVDIACVLWGMAKICLCWGCMCHMCIRSLKVCVVDASGTGTGSKGTHLQIITLYRIRHPHVVLPPSGKSGPPKGRHSEDARRCLAPLPPPFQCGVDAETARVLGGSRDGRGYVASSDFVSDLDEEPLSPR